MTFAEVKEILEKAKFNMCHCGIPEENPWKVSDGVVATLKNGVYEVYFVDMSPLKLSDIQTRMTQAGIF